MTKLLCAILLLSGNLLFSQHFEFDDNGYAETTLTFPNQTPDEVYARTYKFIKLYYSNKDGIPHFDSIKKTFKMPGIMFGVLNRHLFKNREPRYINSKYKIEVAVINNTIKIAVQHEKFVDGLLDYYLELKGLKDGSSPLAYKNEYEYFVSHFDGILKSFSRAITDEIYGKYYSTGVDIAQYKNPEITFSKEGIANYPYNTEHDENYLFGLSQNCAAVTYFNQIEIDTTNNIITIRAKIYDVFKRADIKEPKKPIVNSSVIISMKITGQRTNYTIQHLYFMDAGWEQNKMSLEDVVSKNKIFDINDDDLANFYKSYTKYLSSYLYYLDTAEIQL